MSPGAKGPRQDDAKIRQTVRARGGKVLFIGLDDKGRVFVLVNMAKVKDPKKLRTALKAVAGGDVVLKTPAEAEGRRRRR